MKKLKALVFLFFCFSVFLFFLALKLHWVVLPTLVRVQRVDCKTQYGSCTQEEERRLENLLGKDFLQLDTPFSAAKIAESDFRIRRALVEKVFPSSLTVILEKRKATVGIAVANGVFLLDSEGMVIAFEKTTTLPILYGVKSDLVVGEAVSPEIASSAKVLYLVNNAQGAKSAQLNGGVIQVNLPGDISAQFSLDTDIEARVGALQLILSRIRMDEKLPKTIDLRYSKPILRY